MSNQALARLVPRQGDRRRLQALLARGWRLPSPAEHPLGRLQGRSLGKGFRLLVLLGAKNSVGARYLQLFLLRQDRLSRQPIAFGLHNSGPYPVYNWLEIIRYDPASAFDGETADLREERLEARFFRLLADLLPPGGHLMVEYESPGQRESERILALGYPPLASPLGYLLFRAGCLSFRDWYIPEGGREGPRKLQGFKPLDEEQARQRAAALAGELRDFLTAPSTEGHAPWQRLARRLARRALRALERVHRLDGPTTPR